MGRRMYIAGSWTDGVATETIEVRSPATGESLGEVPVATPEDVDRAARAARKGQEALEQGKPLRTEAVAEIEESAENFRIAAEDVKRMTTEVLPSEDPNKKMFTFRKPNGVYAAISPWNFPFVIPSELLAPALAGGNAVIFKPSEYTPLIGARMIEILEEA